MLYFSANLFEETVDANNRYISKKSVQHEIAVRRTSNFVSPGVL
jgi:hypothetical protein